VSDLPFYPPEHTKDWYALEEEALERARELLHEEDGRICDALHLLEPEYRESLRERYSRRAGMHSETDYDAARRVARKLACHVEQCWATAVMG
jgi:hypothetical protein